MLTTLSEVTLFCCISAAKRGCVRIVTSARLIRQNTGPHLPNRVIIENDLVSGRARKFCRNLIDNPGEDIGAHHFDLRGANAVSQNRSR